MWMVGNRRRGWRVREIVVCVCVQWGNNNSIARECGGWRERERDNIVRSTFLDCKRRKNDK